jgi:hypothetical protein
LRPILTMRRFSPRLIRRQLNIPITTVLSDVVAFGDRLSDVARPSLIRRPRLIARIQVRVRAVVVVVVVVVGARCSA